jgi:hypothetical protein
MMKDALIITALSILLAAPTAVVSQSGGATEQAAVRALNFEQGDAQSLTKSRDDFTPQGWDAFMKTMQGFLDAKGAPTFSCKFVPEGASVRVKNDSGESVLKIPGTLTQTSGGSRTTYRLRVEVTETGDPPKIQHLEQVTCSKEHAANYCM